MDEEEQEQVETGTDGVSSGMEGGSGDVEGGWEVRRAGDTTGTMGGMGNAEDMGGIEEMGGRGVEDGIEDG